MCNITTLNLLLKKSRIILHNKNTWYIEQLEAVLKKNGVGKGTRHSSAFTAGPSIVASLYKHSIVSIR